MRKKETIAQTEYPNCMKNGCPVVDAKGMACKHCGFDRKENKRRRELLRTQGLTFDPRTKLRRLVLRKEIAK